MPARKNTELYGLRDVKIRKLISDSPNVSAPTYGTAIDVPGSAALEITPEIASEDLRGDDTLIAAHSMLDGYTVSLTFVQTDLDVWATVFGGTVTTPDSDTARLDVKAGTELPYFRLDGLIEQTASGLESVRYVIWKMRITDATVLDTDQQEFAELEIEGRAVALEASDAAYNGLYFSQIHSTLSQDLNSGP